MNLRRFAAALAGTAVLLTGCGSSDVPTKSEFVSKMKSDLSDQIDEMAKAGLDRADAEKLFDDFTGCTYDKIKGDEELVTKLYEDGTRTDIDAQLDKRAGDCVDQLTTAAQDAAMSAATGG